MIADTICAISTPPGVGGIAVARVSGPDAIAIVDRIWKGRRLADTPGHTARFGTVTDTAGRALDEAVVTVFRGPASFTGEDTVEISTHGSRFIQRELIAALIAAGCRLAEPGEFTRRAFIAGRFDLAQAEAVADMIAADSRAAHRAAINQMSGTYSRRLNDLRSQLIDLAALLELELDFSEEDVEFASREKLSRLAGELHDELTRLHRSFAAGQAIKDGIPVAIVGPTNAGKSSLLNAILGEDRAIVSDIHGTTRDTIQETIEIGDYRFRFIDTAGLRDTVDPIERQGIDRTRREIGRARIVIHVIDGADPRATFEPIDAAPDVTVVRVVNKADIASSVSPVHADAITLSAMTGSGIDTLRSRLTDIALRDDNPDILVTNLRHAEELRHAADSISRFIDGLRTGDLPLDLLAQDLRDTTRHLAAITAQIPSSTILATIFSRFCIGK